MRKYNWHGNDNVFVIEKYTQVEKTWRPMKNKYAKVLEKLVQLTKDLTFFRLNRVAVV
jgi:hypothetical protein